MPVRRNESSSAESTDAPPRDDSRTGLSKATEVTAALERAAQYGSEPVASFPAVLSFEGHVQTAFDTWRTEKRQQRMAFYALCVLPVMGILRVLGLRVAMPGDVLDIESLHIRALLILGCIWGFSAMFVTDDTAVFNTVCQFANGIVLCYRMDTIYTIGYLTEELHQTLIRGTVFFVVGPTVFKYFLDPPIWWCAILLWMPTVVQYGSRSNDNFRMQPGFFMSTLVGFVVTVMIDCCRRQAFITDLKVAHLEHKVGQLQEDVEDSKMNQELLLEYQHLDEQMGLLAQVLQQ